jgi:myo-inositol-1(or 4)-monophosphatase
MAEPLRAYLDFAVETAWEAGQLTLGYFQTGLRPDFKADDTPVTVADREAEQLIRRRIESRYPTHTILGEEFGASGGAGGSHRWIIDPIDGTRSFIRGVPLYGVLIGLEIEGRAVVGVAHFPPLNEMVAAATGEGCRWNGRPARVSPVSSLKEGLVSHYDAASFAQWGRGQAWERLQQTAGYRAGWCDAYGYALVATGRAELMLDPEVNLWDSAPFPVIFAEAGGYFGSWRGERAAAAVAGDVLGTTERLLPEVLSLVNAD